MAEKDVDLEISADATAVIASLRRVEDAMRNSASHLKAGLDTLRQGFVVVLKARADTVVGPTHFHLPADLIPTSAKPFEGV
ncbi:MAG TPA: hypothetical protein VK130_07635 [Steroidobacteraceae bacterium]|nr:hypothetical protein [Steroidobacteraceae bacterium]